MRRYIVDAREEMKRADHLLFVSLKYTRTVDVIKSLIDRLISALDAALNGVLEYLRKKKVIDEVPVNIGIKCELLKKKVSDEKILEMVNFYLFLRKISRADYKRSREYRRHVTMTAIYDEGVIDINIDLIKQYYEDTIAYIDYVEEFVGLVSPEMNE